MNAKNKNRRMQKNAIPSMEEAGPVSESKRKFLKLLGLSSVAAAGLHAGAAGAFPPEAQTLSSGVLDKETQVDVVVIGGGFAGITAAREACKAGLRTVVLEARNRLGGRTFSTKFGEEPVELGGTWIHWFQPHVWSETLHYNLEVEEIPGFAAPEKMLFLSGGKLRDLPIEQAAQLLTSAADKFFEEGPNIFPRPYDNFYKADLVRKHDGMSCTDRMKELHLSQDQTDILMGLLETMASGSCTKAAYLDALKWWALSGNNLPIMNDALARYTFKKGTISLINAMVADAKIPVFLSTPAAKVVRDGSGVQVAARNGKIIKGKKAIVAVPLNVLKNIQFEPGISPGKLEASKETHLGSGTKVHIRVKGRIPSLTAYAYEPVPFSGIFTEKFGDDRSMLVAFGSSAGLIDIHSPAEVQKALRKFLPSVEVEETLGYDWTLDPYSQGTWCIYRPNMLTKYLHELQKPEGNVHFACSDWANGWRGFIDGAIESGLRTGQAVVQAMRG